MRYSIARFGSLMRLLCIRYSLLLRRPRSLLPRWLPLQAKVVGGAEEARTPDPLLAKEVLSQLSYGPRWSGDAMSDVGGCGSIVATDL